MKLNFFGGNSPKLDWQKLKSRQKQIPDLYRCAVPGGWLIGSGEGGALAFIPDPEHQWDGESVQPAEEK